ncbi:hypothetical protein ILUMI_07337 [Ignelater luminosus]|uniref:Uncharacterized protein n=1 Tax=Ignelater luminosus TaxID=2038154 RepID=A0A8K0D428_IGNLU|nr:hypothetical protein ILUMI_07337 [Ignelater luminosus]
MAEKVLCQRIKKPITNELAPHQLGVEIPRGAEIGACAAWTYINAKHKSPEYLDDVTIGDNLVVVLADLDVVQKMAVEVGLTLNSSKCEMAVVGA